MCSSSTTIRQQEMHPNPQPQIAGAKSAGWKLATFVFGSAVILRLLHVWQLQTSVFGGVLLGDAKTYDQWGVRLAAGDWLGTGVFYQAPLYPYLLGVIYALGGHDLRLVRVVQALLGAVSCALLADAARRLFTPAAGMAAGVVLAVSGQAIFAGGLLQKSTLDLFFVCLSVWLVSTIAVSSEHSSSEHRWRWLALGATTGALALTRENALALAIPLALWSLSTPGPVPRRLMPTAWLLSGILVLLAPVAIRNSLLGDTFYLSTSQFGPNLYIGNHADASGLYEPLRAGRGTPEFEQQDATELAEAATGQRLTPGEVSSYWTGRAIEFAMNDPAAWIRVTGRKLRWLFTATEVPDTEAQESHEDVSPVLALLAPLTHFGVILPLAALGLWAARSRWRQLWIVPALASTYAATIVAFYVMARYRYPLLPFLVLFAASAVPSLATAWRGARPHARIVCLAATATLVVVCNWPVTAAGNRSRAVTENNIGRELQVTGQREEALTHYRRAIELDADFADAHLNAGAIYAATGARPAAHDAFAKAAALAPDNARAHQFYGRILMEEGAVAQAIEELQRARQLDPATGDIANDLGLAFIQADRLNEAIDAFRDAVSRGVVNASSNLGNALADRGAALLDSGSYARAIEDFRASIRLTPPSADTWNRLGVALAQQGDAAAALDAFRSALSVDPDFADAKRNLAVAGASVGQTRR